MLQKTILAKFMPISLSHLAIDFILENNIDCIVLPNAFYIFSFSILEIKARKAIWCIIHSFPRDFSACSIMYLHWTLHFNSTTAPKYPKTHTPTAITNTQGDNLWQFRMETNNRNNCGSYVPAERTRCSHWHRQKAL